MAMKSRRNNVVFRYSVALMLPLGFEGKRDFASSLCTIETCFRRSFKVCNAMRASASEALDAIAPLIFSKSAAFTFPARVLLKDSALKNGAKLFLTASYCSNFCSRTWPEYSKNLSLVAASCSFQVPTKFLASCSLLAALSSSC